MSKRRWRWIGTAAGVAAIGAIVAALYPILKDVLAVAHDQFSPAPMSKWSAALSNCRVDPEPVSLAEYLPQKYSANVLKEKIAKYTKDEMQQTGRVIRFHAALTGQPRMKYPVLLYMFDATTLARVPVGNDPRITTLVSDSKDESFESIWWFQVPARANQYYIRLEVRNLENQPMGDCQTPVF